MARPCSVPYSWALAEGGRVDPLDVAALRHARGPGAASLDEGGVAIDASPGLMGDAAGGARAAAAAPSP